MYSKLLTQLRTLNSKLLTQFLPPHCISCSAQGAYLCKTCKKRLNPHPEICPYCHRFSPNYVTCLDCKTTQKTYLEGIIIPFSYEEEMKRIILKVKYFHKKDMVNFLAERLTLAVQINQTIMTHIDKGKTIITYVPSHRYRRIFIKGYNQSELLARALAQQLNIPYAPILYKKKYTRSQAQLNKIQRNKNLENAFQLYTNAEWQETIIIVDDVTTTGSTLNSMAKVIKSKYPKSKLRGIVLCRHRG